MDYASEYVSNLEYQYLGEAEDPYYSDGLEGDIVEYIQTLGFGGPDIEEEEEEEEQQQLQEEGQDNSYVIDEEGNVVDIEHYQRERSRGIFEIGGLVSRNSETENPSEDGDYGEDYSESLGEVVAENAFEDTNEVVGENGDEDATDAGGDNGADTGGENVGDNGDGDTGETGGGSDSDTGPGGLYRYRETNDDSDSDSEEDTGIALTQIFSRGPSFVVYDYTLDRRETEQESAQSFVRRELLEIAADKKLRHTPSKEKLRAAQRFSSWVQPGSKFAGVYKPRLNLCPHLNEVMQNTQHHVISANIRTVNHDNGHVCGILRGSPFEDSAVEFEGDIVEPDVFLEWIAKKVPRGTRSVHHGPRTSSTNPRNLTLNTARPVESRTTSSLEPNNAEDPFVVSALNRSQWHRAPIDRNSSAPFGNMARRTLETMVPAHARTNASDFDAADDSIGSSNSSTSRSLRTLNSSIPVTSQRFHIHQYRAWRSPPSSSTASSTSMSSTDTGTFSSAASSYNIRNWPGIRNISNNTNTNTNTTNNTNNNSSSGTDRGATARTSARPVTSSYLDRVAHNFSMLRKEHIHNIGEAKFAQDFRREKFCMFWTLWAPEGQERDHYYVVIDHKDGTLDAINVSNVNFSGDSQYEKLRMEPTDRRMFPSLSLCP